MNQQTNNYYFKKFYSWSISDIKKCLELPNNAGPALVIVLNGMDILGGMLYDFRKMNARGMYKGNSEDRFKRFIKEEINKDLEKSEQISECLARFVYKSVRCGMVHEGMSRARLWFGYNGKKIFYKDFPEEKIYLNVGAFASAYINTIERIHNNVDTSNFFKPPSEVLESLFTCAKTDLEVNDTVFQGGSDDSKTTNSSSSGYSTAFSH